MEDNKWTSRKFWTTVVSQVVGVVTLVAGIAIADQTAIIAGAIITIAVTLGYLKAEKDVDVARVKGE